MEAAELARLTEDAIYEAHARKEYRPVAMAIVIDRFDRVLLVRSAANLDEWYLPQGGIEDGESLHEALHRELGEETGIGANDLQVERYAGAHDLDAEPCRKDKRGFTKGKRYFAVKLRYFGAVVLTLAPSELAGYEWLAVEDVRHRLATTRPEKRELILKILGIG